MSEKTKKAIMIFFADLLTNLAAGGIGIVIAATITKDWTSLIFNSVFATLCSYISIMIRRYL